jgi:N utilization substance protein B
VKADLRRAREAALQILYAWEIGQAEPLAAIETFFQEHEPEAAEVVRKSAARLVLGTVGDLDAIDQVIGAHSTHWRVERLAVLDRLILRLAIWELRHARDMPPAVVINEAIELARRFSTDDAARFVNGVLDAAAKETTPGVLAQATEKDEGE